MKFGVKRSQSGNPAALSTTIATRLTEHEDDIKSLFRGAPHLGLALGPARARDDHGSGLDRTAILFKIGESGLDRTEKIFVVLL